MTDEGGHRSQGGPRTGSARAARSHRGRALARRQQRATAPTTSTPTCAASTATTPRPPAGTTWCSPNVGMPHVLWELQGERAAEFEDPDDHDPSRPFTRSRVSSSHARHHEQAGVRRQPVGDLVGYLQWMGEPAQNPACIGVGAGLPGSSPFIAWRLNAASGRTSSKALRPSPGAGGRDSVLAQWGAFQDAHCACRFCRLTGAPPP